MIPLAEHRARHMAAKRGSRLGRLWLHNPDEQADLLAEALGVSPHPMFQEGMGYVYTRWVVEGFTYRSTGDGTICVAEGCSADIDCHPHFGCDGEEVALDLNTGEVWSGGSNRGWSPFEPHEHEGWLCELTAHRAIWAAVYEVATQQRRRHPGAHQFEQALVLRNECDHKSGWVLL